MNRDLGIPNSLSEVGVTEDKIEAMAKDCGGNEDVAYATRRSLTETI